MTAIEKMTDFAPGQRVEWRNGDEISTGTLVEPDNGLGGPWWLVDLDEGSRKQSLVKTWALYPAGGIRLQDTADAIHRVMRQLGRDRGAWYYPSWSYAYAYAEVVVAMDGAA